MALSLVQTRLAPSATPELQAALRHASDELRLALAEFRQLARGLHPAILDKGLAAAVESVSEQAQLPVTVSVPPKRFAAVVEMTAYFVVCEALANIAKHARASAATVTVQQTKGRLVVEVSDDGLGGADPGRGSGLTGLVDRVATLGGRLRIDSPIGRGTRVRAELPCG